MADRETLPTRPQHEVLVDAYRDAVQDVELFDHEGGNLPYVEVDKRFAVLEARRDKAREALLAALASATRDAERLDWLQANWVWRDDPEVEEPHESHVYGCWDADVPLRDAIDEGIKRSALSEQRPKE